MSEFKQFKPVTDGNIPTSVDYQPSPNLIRFDKDVSIKERLVVNDNETEILHGQKMKITEIVAGFANTYFTKLNDYNIAIKDVTISRGVQLPDAASAGIGKLYVIKDISGSAASTTITVAALEGQSLDGEPTQSITSNWGVKRVFTDQANWFTW